MLPEDLGDAPELVEAVVEGGWRQSDHVRVAEVAGHAGRHQGSMEAGGVAVAAHLGGFAAGLVLTPLFKKKNAKLFQRGRTRAFSRHARRIR